MKSVATVLVVLWIAAGPVSAQWYDTRTGMLEPDAPWRKSIEGLGAALLLTRDIDAFLKEWDGTPSSYAPTIKTASRAKRGDTVAAIVAFTGCRGASGTCNATVDFKVLKPDGSVYADLQGARAWAGLSPKARVVVLSEAQLRIRIEPTDPLGEYIVLGTLRQLDTGRSLNLKQTFRVIE
jgi:hypothetical protein